MEVLLSNGNHIDCTGNEKFMSDHGWVYLADLLPWEEAKRCPKTSKAKASRSQSGTNGLWDSSGGFMPYDDKRQFKECDTKVLRNTRPVSGTILHSQGGSVGGPSENEAQDYREQGLGGEKLRFFLSVKPHIRLYSPSMLHGYFRQELAQKESDPRVDQPLDLGGDSLVVDGRRKLGTDGSEWDIQYPEFFKNGSRLTSSLPEVTGGSVSSANTKEQKVGGAILGHIRKCKWYQGIIRKHKGILIPRNGVQVGVQRSKFRKNLQDLCINFYFNIKQEPLFKAGMQTCVQKKICECMARKKQRANQDKIKTKILGRYRGIKKKGERDSKEIEARSCSSFQTTRKKKEIQTISDKLLFLFRNVCGRRQYIKNETVLPSSGMPLQSKKDERGIGSLQPEENFSSIAGIAYLGVDDVYDIETEKHHTFFANGIGVHNCQDLNADFIPQIREVLGTSDYRYESYFGTARGIDNTLTKLFENSTQNEWMMRCTKCKHENFPTIAGEVLKMVQIKGISCTKCMNLLDVERGQWIRSFEYDQIHRDAEGYHIPQIIVRDRLQPHDRYIETIYNKLNGSNAISEARFLQEILGIPTSQGGVPLTQKDIKDTSTLDFDLHEPPNAQIYQRVAGGVDWGGAEVVSFTVGVAVGYRDGYFDVLGATRPTGLPDEQRHFVIGEYLKTRTGSRIELVGADAGFVGSVQNPNLGSFMGVPVGSIAYGTTKKFFMPNTNNCFTVDRTTLIYIVFTLIKAGRIRFPKGGWFEQYTRDLLAVFTEDATNSHGATIRRYARYQDKPDDFLHALGYAIFMCSLGITDLPAMAGMATNLSINASYINDIGMEMGNFGN